MICVRILRLEEVRAQAQAEAKAAAQAQVEKQVKKILAAEEAAYMENLTDSIMKERMKTEDENLLVQFYVSKKYIHTYIWIRIFPTDMKSFFLLIVTLFLSCRDVLLQWMELKVRREKFPTCMTQSFTFNLCQPAAAQFFISSDETKKSFITIWKLGITLYKILHF